MWNEIGNNIVGDSTFGYAVAMSSDGNTIVVGSPGSLNNSIGSVSVYKYKSNSWRQAGNTIINSTGLNFGSSVAINSDGSVIAVGAINTQKNGYTAVYQYDCDCWNQIGTNINIPGFSVSISKRGDIVAIGTSITSCVVFKYAKYSRSWTQMGNTIVNFLNNKLFGYSISLSASGNTVAIGAFEYVAIYQYNSQNNIWMQLGTNLTNLAGGLFGFSISISGNGRTVAVGAANILGQPNTGYVAVYYYTDDNYWAQLANNINIAGFSIAISANGNIIAIGTPGTNSAVVYSYANGNWTQVMNTIYNPSKNNFGYAISISCSGNKIIVGSYLPNSTTAGYVATYSDYPLISNNNNCPTIFCCPTEYW